MVYLTLNSGSPMPKKSTARKEHAEHQKALKPLLKHLKADEKKLAKKAKK